MSRPRTVGAFVRARRAAWERLDALAGRAAGGRLPLAEVEELDRLYRRAAGDLAHARAAFAGSDAEGHLSQVLARAYAALYRPPPRGPAAVLRFYREEVPAAFRAHLPALAAAAGLLAAGIAAGALAVAWDPGAAGLLVPDGVRSAVAGRRMWTEGLLSAAPGVWGSAIAHNNVSAAALAFALGLTGGVGTALLLLANGLLLGAVAAHAFQGGMGAPFLSFVSAHGPAELSALLLAAQAGFALAGALVAPGEWPRALALQRRGREGARLLAVVVPVLALVALLEAGVSPSPAIPAQAKAALGLGLAAALWAALLRGGGRRAGGAGAPVSGRAGPG
ncbi:MAG TPA: stage II sporulation protein M [Anaeromyxobacter sp.]|nr:stage II sporulation protein M [Anaeromyxobacter sp.]